MVKPKIVQHEKGFNITVRDEKQLNQVIAGLLRKHPNLDVSDLYKKMQYSEEPLGERLNIDLSMGGEMMLKAVAKIAVNVYLFKGGDTIAAKPIIEQIRRGISNSGQIYFHFIPDSLTWENSEIVHLVHIRGDKRKRVLFAYVVLFSAFPFIVNINEDYGGEDIEIQYAFDVNGQNEVVKAFSLDYAGSNDYHRASTDEEDRVANLKIINSIQINLSRVTAIAHKKQFIKTYREILVENLKEILSRYPDGTVITQEIINEVVQAAVPKLAKFLRIR